MIKGITLKIRNVEFCPSKLSSFEPFVFGSCFRTLAVILVSEVSRFGFSQSACVKKRSVSTVTICIITPRVTDHRFVKSAFSTQARLGNRLRCSDLCIFRVISNVLEGGCPLSG